MSKEQVRLSPRQPYATVANVIRCLVEARGTDNYGAAKIVAEERVPALTVLPKIFERGAVGAQPLGANDPFNFAKEVYLALIVDELRALLDRFVNVPPRLKIPLENGSGGNANWVGQGLASAILNSTSAVATLDIYQMTAYSVLTRELFRFGVDQQNTFMRLLRADVSRFLALALFDSTKGATANNPASLTYFGHPVTSTGSTAAQMTTDLNTMIANVNLAMVDPAWVMRPSTFYRIAATLGGAGLNVSKDNLFGIPVTLLSGMPKEVVLVDCASVFLASDAAAELSISTDASVEMSDAPTSSGISGTGVQLVSFFQSGLVGVSSTLTINFVSPYLLNTSPQVPSGIVFMTTSY